MNAPFKGLARDPGDRPRFYEIPEILEHLPFEKDGLYREIHAGSMAAIRIGGTQGGKYVIPSRVLDLLTARMRGDAFDTTVTDSAGRFLSITETASILRISSPILSKRVRGGEFPAVKYGGKYIVAGAVIDDMETQALSAMTLVRTDDYVVCARQALEVAA